MYQNNKILISSESKVSDIIFDNAYFLLMLEHFEIDLALHEKSIEQICQEYKINIELFLTIANLYNGFKPSSTVNFTFEDTKIIINYLRKSHQYYLNEKYPEIRNYIEKIYEINSHTEIILVEKFFDKYFKEVTEHLDYENKIAFPYILNLLNHTGKNQNKYSIKEYSKRHDDIEEKLIDLKNLLIKYLPQKNDHKIRRNLLFSLVELEYDLTIHTQIEDLILVPIVKKMEQQYY